MKIARGVRRPHRLLRVRTAPPVDRARMRSPKADWSRPGTISNRRLYLRLVVIRLQDLLDAFWRVIPR